MADRPLLIVAGEASGDLHGARLLTQLRRVRPGQQAFGLGGDELREAGLDVISDEPIAVVGIVEVLKVLARARRVRDQLLAAVRLRRPAAAVLIDMPEFNLRLAKRLKALGIPVVYYISPQIWAWRQGRVRQVAERVDRMLVFFPFEVDFYRQHGVSVTHVGHPLVDEVPELPQIWDEGPPAAAEGYRIALLPGSRPGEVATLLPTLLEAVEELRQRLPQRPPLDVRLVRASTISEAQLAAILGDRRSGSPAPTIVSEGRFQTIADSHVALCASGTVTLEIGLLRTPLVIGYRLSRWTYWLAQRLVKLDHYSLVNLVLEDGVAPELIQDEMTPRRFADEAFALLTDPSRRQAQRQALAQLRPRLGAKGASQRAATEVAAVLTAEAAL